MKITYLALVDPSTELGVAKKICEQTSYWASVGHRVHVLSMSKNEGEWKVAPSVAATVIRHDGGMYGRLRASRLLAQAAIENSPDIIYLRSGTPYEALISLASSAPLILEVNSDDQTEIVLRFGRIIGSVYSWQHRRMVRASRGIVAVTKELASRLPTGEAVAVIPNGIDLKSVRRAPTVENGFPRLVFIGTPGLPWHGIDKIVELASAFPEWRFEMVGPDAPSDPAPRNVHWHGLVPPDQAAAIAAGCDIAIGTLALYRKGMNESCALKVRGYVAAGLPVIMAGSDPDFSSNADAVLQLDNQPTNIANSLELIEKFVMRWKGKRVEADVAKPLSIHVKEDLRLEFFRHIAALGRK